MTTEKEKNYHSAFGNDPYLGIPEVLYKILEQPLGFTKDEAEDTMYDLFLSQRFRISVDKVDERKDWLLMNLAGLIHVSKTAKVVSK